eukprot:gene5420-5962_t
MTCNDGEDCLPEALGKIDLPKATATTSSSTDLSIDFDVLRSSDFAIPDAKHHVSQFHEKSPSIHVVSSPEGDIDLDLLDSVLFDDASLDANTINDSIGKKLNRDEAFGSFEEEAFDARKYLRRGTLDEIISSAMTVSEPETMSMKAEKATLQMFPKSKETRDEERKRIASTVLRYLGDFDITNLARHIQRYCHDEVMFLSSFLKEPIFGKANMMIFMCLSMEAYPDKVAPVTKVEVEDQDMISCYYDFKATKVFSYPIDTMFKYIQKRVNSEAVVKKEGDAGLAGMVLREEVAEQIRPSILNNPLTMQAAAEKKKNGIHAGFDLETYYHHMARLEDAVMKDGKVIYRARVDFSFDENDRIIRIASYTI